jgi:pyridoxamine 5'-phosphate oxidase
MSNISDIRKDYLQQSLTEDTIAPDPIRQFDVWWAAALQAKLDEVNAMTLATASADGIPSARIVLLKGYDERGFVFFTNYQSEKGQDLIANPHASLVFFWPTLERQVRINGSAEKVSSAESDEYFNSRPVGSRIGAWASPQSEVIKSRDLLEQNVTELERKYADGSIPRPPHWGGFRIIPNSIEFWQGRPNRLHDRIRYTLIGEEWVIERLAP